MITIYGDEIADDPTDPHTNNRYLTVNIENPDDENQHFTGHPQLDYSVFKYINEGVEFKTIDNYIPGKNVVIIGLHGGWNIDKLTQITKWFTKDSAHLKPWFDRDCLIVLDYSEEGFTTEVFGDVWTWIEQYNLQDRVLYVSSSSNVATLYREWCYLTRHYANMRTAWYGFFPNWLLKDHGAHTVVSQSAEWTTRTPRWMSLTRRPYQHRILLTTLLEHYRILDSGGVSMPRDFSEREVQWKPEDFDIPLQWSMLKDRVNGSFDSLDPAFDRMYAKLPLVADTDDFGTNYALNLNDDFYRDYPINLVSETLFFSAATFQSEKIWKPMLMEQIFIVMAAPYYLASLRDMGFKTFAPWINEDYDLMLDPVERALAVVTTLKDILALDDEEFAQLLDHCRPILDHNRAVLTDKGRLEQVINTGVAQAIETTWAWHKL